GAGHARGLARSVAPRRRRAPRARPRARRGARAARRASRFAALPAADRSARRRARPGRGGVGHARGEGALMNWPAIFLGCFIVRPVLSALPSASSPLRLHVPLPFVHQLHLHVHAPHALHAPHVPHAAPAPGAPHGGASDGVSPVSFPTLMAFLAWFGGTGYLLTSQFRWPALPAPARPPLP